MNEVMTVLVAFGLIVGAIVGHTLWPIALLAWWWLGPPELKYWIRLGWSYWLPLPYSVVGSDVVLESGIQLESADSGLESGLESRPLESGIQFETGNCDVYGFPVALTQLHLQLQKILEVTGGDISQGKVASLFETNQGLVKNVFGLYRDTPSPVLKKDWQQLLGGLDV